MPSSFEILTALADVLIFGLALLTIIRINTIVHEAAHALAMRRLVKGPITVFLGSYGNKAGSWPIRMGRFEIWFRKNPVRWWGGLCMHEEQPVSPRSQAIYVVAGPLASLALCLISLALFTMVDPQGVLAPFIVMACVYFGLSFLGNIIPRDMTVKLQDGRITYTDGKRLQQLWMLPRLPPAYHEAVGHYKEGEYGKAADILEGLIAGGLRKKDIYRCAIDASIRAKTYARADALQKELSRRFAPLTSQDKMQLGFLKIYLGNYSEAIGYLKHLLELEGPNKFNLNNLGYVLTITGEYETAIAYLNKAIAIDSRFSYALANRGYALLQSGQLEAGKADIDLGWELNPETAYGYRNRGVYYFHMRDYPEAMEAFEQARTLDADVPGLDKAIRETRLRMSRGKRSSDAYLQRESAGDPYFLKDLSATPS